MKALLLKDFYNLSKSLRSLVFVLVCYSVFSVALGQASFLTSFMPVLCAMVPITSCSFDEFAKWDLYALSMPISRKTMVLEKYALGLLMLLAGMACSFVVGFLCMTTSDSNGVETLVELFAAAGVSTLLSLLVQALVFPIIVKYGVEKGRIAMFAAFLIPAVLIVLVAKSLSSLSVPPAWLFWLPETDPETLVRNGLLLGFPVAAVLLGLSFLLSLRFYRAKEF